MNIARGSGIEIANIDLIYRADASNTAQVVRQRIQSLTPIGVGADLLSSVNQYHGPAWGLFGALAGTLSVGSSGKADGAGLWAR